MNNLEKKKSFKSNLRDLIRLLNGSYSLKLRFLKLFNKFNRISLDIDILIKLID
jgi:hypothetical protein